LLIKGNLPTDPLDFYTRLYNATSEPFAQMADDILRDESFLKHLKRLFDYYSTFNIMFSRAPEEYVSNRQIPTTSDMDRVAGLIVTLDDRNDRIEEMMEELEDSYKKQSTSTETLEKRLERVESRLDPLNRVEEKLDQLVATQNTAVDGCPPRSNEIRG
jgi:uncharacterized phage infection (PIP) family protein YhgE